MCFISLLPKSNYKIGLHMTLQDNQCYRKNVNEGTSSKLNLDANIRLKIYYKLHMNMAKHILTLPECL